MIKWADYHKQDSTWEPSSNLSPELIDSFLSPPVGDFRLQVAAQSLETAIHQRLSSKQTSVSLSFELDIFRYIFNTRESVLISHPDDLRKLPLCDNWFNWGLKLEYAINRN